MRYVFLLVCVLFITSPFLLRAQTLTDSNLPIVIIAIDNNASIPDNPRVLGTMKIISKGEGERNFVSDQNNAAALNYNGRIEIEVRGSSSQFLEKKQYGLTTLQPDNISNNNVSLLGMPKENDWVLNGLAFDPSLMRDYISYTLSRRIGQYAPRTVYCEVIINGDYRGIYLLQEKIKADDNRVDVAKIESTDNTLPDLSGGYITKADKVTWEDPYAWQMSSYLGENDVNYIHELPKPSTVTSAQNNYIRSVFMSLNSRAGNNSITNGFPSIIDVPSFIDFMIMNELAANVDGYQFSTYFHKDRSGKLRAGPLWDFNLTYGNDLFLWNLDRSKTNRWQFDNGDNIGSRFWKDLFNNTTYRCYFSRRWNELTQPGQPLHLTSLESFIDETVATLQEASAREFARWKDEKENWLTNLDMPTQVTGIKSFLAERITWITTGLGSFSACNNIQTPPLVITRISYHPATSSGFPDSNDQEFIEITNNSDASVNLTGIYFSGTGFAYQFAAGATLEPRGVIQLANHRETFELLYGFMPYGEFARNLSNDGQTLTLADGFGNVIDEVAYDDQTPWPNADGNGSHLKLISADLDNSIASNWTASTEPVVSTIVGMDDDLLVNIELYPNPTSGVIMVSAAAPISVLHVRDLRGAILKTLTPNSNTVTLDLNAAANGLYILELTLNQKTAIRKIIKEQK